MCEKYLAYKPLNYPAGHIYHLRSLNLPREEIPYPITHAISNKHTVCLPKYSFANSPYTRDTLSLSENLYLQKTKELLLIHKKNSVCMNYIQYDWWGKKERRKMHTPAIRR